METLDRLARAAGDARTEHYAYHFLADCALTRGDPEEARTRYRHSLQAAHLLMHTNNGLMNGKYAVVVDAARSTLYLYHNDGVRLRYVARAEELGEPRLELLLLEQALGIEQGVGLCLLEGRNEPLA